MEFLFLTTETGMDIGHSSALRYGFVNISFSKGNLLLILFLVLSKLSALEVGLDEQPDLEPLPGLGKHV